MLASRRVGFDRLTPGPGAFDCTGAAWPMSWGARRRSLLSLLWLSILVGGDAHLFDHHVSTGHRSLVLALQLGIVIVFVATLACPEEWWDRPHGLLLIGSVALLWASVGALATVDGAGWIYAIAYSVVPAIRSGGRGALAVLPLGALYALVLGLAIGEPTGSLIGTVVSILGTGAVVFGFSRLIRANQALAQAQEERAQVAVSEERARFARDLHDLLGHSLSVVALKSEVAQRLLPEAPDRAAAEVDEIEQVARGALREVREAVSGYRRPTLAVEIAGARTALAAAGITWAIDGDGADLPGPVEAVLAWSVREGVTNVMRHSNADSCTIRVMVDGDAATVAVVDDGEAATATKPAAGNGLAGLAERVDAVNGQMEAGPQPAGGFRLRVSVPLSSGD